MFHEYYVHFQEVKERKRKAQMGWDEEYMVRIQIRNLFASPGLPPMCFVLQNIQISTELKYKFILKITPKMICNYN